MNVTRAVVLARGLGKRMQSADARAMLTPEQQRAADAGMKAMMPIGDRPFLDFVLSAIADGGIHEVAIVVAPEHETVRRYYRVTARPVRLALNFVVQEQPLGTADAVLAVEPWVEDDPFLVMNSDNLYPAHVIRDLVSAGGPALPAFDREELVQSSNIDPERIRAFALIDVDAEGYLERIVEKPQPGEAGAHALVSMNCWRFDSRIFDACRRVARSPRGEYELPQAVGLAVRSGVRFRVLPARGPILDLSQRADAADVSRRLAGVTPQP